MTDHDQSTFDRLHQLVTVQLDGELLKEERRQLQQLLQSNSLARRHYVEYLDDTTTLRWWAAEPEEDVTLPPLNAASPRKGPSTKRVRVYPAIAMSLAAALLVAVAVRPAWRPQAKDAAGRLQSQEQAEGRQAAGESDGQTRAADAGSLATDPDQNSAPGVATLTRLSGASWTSGTKALGELSRLSVGQVLRLDEGYAEIVFDRGVQLVVRAPMHVEVLSPMAIYCRRGVISTRVGEQGKGFAIHTLAGQVTDLGTAFGVAIGAQGETDVAVFRGAVDLTFGSPGAPRGDDVSRRLFRGEALSLDADGNSRRLMAIDNLRFPSEHGLFAPPASTRPAIITDVQDNIRDENATKFYHIVHGGFGEDVLAYVDRKHEWNGLESSGMPEALLGADYVMPFNSDKYEPNVKVTLTISRPAVIYVLLSDAAVVPEWLTAEFVDTGMKIGLDEHAEFSNPEYVVGVGPGEQVDTRFSIWKREILSPGAVTLGSVELRLKTNELGFCMYGIAAAPLK